MSHDTLLSTIQEKIERIKCLMCVSQDHMNNNRLVYARDVMKMVEHNTRLVRQLQDYIVHNHKVREFVRNEIHSRLSPAPLHVTSDTESNESIAEDEDIDQNASANDDVNVNN